MALAFEHPLWLSMKVRPPVRSSLSCGPIKFLFFLGKLVGAASARARLFRWGKRIGFVKCEPWINATKVKHTKGWSVGHPPSIKLVPGMTAWPSMNYARP